MSKQIEIVVLTREAHDFIHLVFRIDKMWRKLGAAAIAGLLTPEQLVSADHAWKQLTAEMKIYLDTLWTQFDNWQSLEIEDSPTSLLKPKERIGIFRKTSSLKRRHGKVYQVSIHSLFGETLLKQCRSLDSCFVILHNALIVSEESLTIIAKVKDYYSALLEKIKIQYNTDIKIINGSVSVNKGKSQNIHAYV
jgi:hypothetical protein